MLKKLLKHEFRATARTYGGLYLALLAMSVLFGASIRGWNGTNSDAYSTAVGLLSLAYTAVLIGTAVVTVMTIVQRFYGNLLGREGYLMHTLPVTEAQLVGAKLISGTVWSVCSIFAAGLSFGILAILMMAECYAETEDSDEAVRYLNMVRERAGTTAYVFKNKDALLEEIQKERGRELLGEFQRKFDLVRWGIWYQMTYEYTNYPTLKDNMLPCHEYYPIPDKEVVYSGGALDNKAYNEYGM